MPSQAVKKSLYIFLCSLLGMLILLSLQHAVLFLYLALATPYGESYPAGIQVETLRSLVWFLSVFIGGWWGVWLGLGWYSVVYEDKKHKGVVHALANKLYSWSVGEATSKKILKPKSKSQAKTLRLSDVVTIKPTVGNPAVESALLKANLPARKPAVRKAGSSAKKTLARQKVKLSVQ